MPYPKGQRWTEEQRAKLRGRTPWHAGKTRATDPRIGAPWEGKARDDETKAKLRASVRAIKGDDITYGAAHTRVRTERGTPSECEHCGTSDPTKRYEWAFTGTRTLGEKVYSVTPEDYIRLCVPCHHAYDRDLT